ncbi:MAG: Leucyl/phenylalanyl-tRNA--protein transferase [Myxococcaceae bacterium]|nr:Leucyl/phenylalanyl-tRNA--protein transferase [Myxococcaceae bacterium]
MPIYMLTDELRFPPPEGASDEGIVAVGGDFRPERLLLGYAQGIFPWPSEGLPLVWFSPDPRFVLPPKGAHIPRSLKKQLRRQTYTVRFDTAFDRVIRACAEARRPGQRGTWITSELDDGYHRLHELGFAHSIEAWNGDRLVGGLFGVGLGRVFFGESMFALEADASKVAFAMLLAQLSAWNFALVDCQVHTEHLERFGAEEWPRERFLDALRASVGSETRRGSWQLELSTTEALALLEH